jgi:hypothetical protein
MNRLSRSLSVFLVSAVLTVPTAFAAARPAQDDHDKEHAKKEAKVDKAQKKLRVYDAKHKDYHDWNENEDRAYRQYLNEKHEDYRDYQKMDRDRQQEYWNWRHDHPDRDDANRDRDDKDRR